MALLVEKTTVAARPHQPTVEIGIRFFASVECAIQYPLPTPPLRTVRTLQTLRPDSRGSGASSFGLYFAPPQIELFDGRLDDNNMKDVTTEMIPFASLRPCAFALNQERKDARAQRMKSAVYAVCPSIPTFSISKI